MSTIIKSNLYNKFKTTNDEYELLDKKFGRLAYDASWKLIRGNLKNNCQVELDDVVSELKFSIYVSACYYKRQTYIENCLLVAKQFCKDVFTVIVLNKLDRLWNDRKKHGASKQKFGDFHEELLEAIVGKYAPAAKMPNPSAELIVDIKFINYCKSILWNRQKALGKKISREKGIRIGLVSLSYNDFML